MKDLGTGVRAGDSRSRAIAGSMRGAIDRRRQRPFSETLAYLLQMAPSFSLRGGTREILRGIIARDLGLR